MFFFECTLSKKETVISHGSLLSFLLKFMILFFGGSRCSSSYTSLVDAVNSLFGRYNPRTHVVTTYLSDGTTVETVEVLPGLAGLDYAWLASVLLFALALYCIFRMIGGLFRWK